MGLPWIKVSVDLPSHPKLQHLESLLPGMDGLAIIIRLWTWAAKYAPDGSFPAHLSVAAGSAVTRDGSVSHAKVLEALITSRWIERGELIWIIHDWRVFQGALVTITEKNRKRQRKHRRAAKIALGHGNVTHDVTPLSRVEKRGEEKRGEVTPLSNSLNSTVAASPVLVPKTRATRQAYETAYREKYGTGPLKAARKTNGQLAQFVELVGADLAPRLAAFYVQQNDPRYAKARHPIGLLFQDAERLFGDMNQGRAMTNTEARRADETQAKADVFSKFLTGGVNAVGTK